MIYIDESGFDEKLRRDYARAPRGEQIVVDVKGKRAQRVNIIAGLFNHQLIAPFMFQGYTKATLFNKWLKELLLPCIPKKSIIIMDNASFHKSKETQELIENAGCQLLFLPPYSPDYNPIENYWAILKSKIRKILPDVEDISNAIEIVFKLQK